MSWPVKEIKHIIFEGVPGAGKTTVAFRYAKALLKINLKQSCFTTTS